MEQTPTRALPAENGKNRMSAELRARLKRCSRNSMVQLTPKRSCAAENILSPSVLTENKGRESYICAADIIGSPINLPALTHNDSFEEMNSGKSSDSIPDLYTYCSPAELKKGLELASSNSDSTTSCREIINIPVLKTENISGVLSTYKQLADDLVNTLGSKTIKQCSSNSDYRLVLERNNRSKVAEHFCSVDATEIYVDAKVLNDAKQATKSNTTVAICSISDCTLNVPTNSTHSASTANTNKTLCNSNPSNSLSFVMSVSESAKKHDSEMILSDQEMLDKGREESPSEVVSMMAGIWCEQKEQDNALESLSQLQVRKRNMEERIAEKEENLRKLRMVKMYRTKNDLTKLKTLTVKWKSVCQEALEDLHRCATVEPRPSMTQLLQMLNVDPLMVGYDVIEESFN